jgi:predicted nucleic acid-binding protein
MTRYLIDTDVLISFSRGREPVTSRLLALLEAGNDLGLCAVTVAEFYAGAERGQHPSIDRFIDALTYWDITPAAARAAGAYRYKFARLGTALSTPDTLIAAVAVRRGATVLTGNRKDFPMDDVAALTL